MKVTVISGSHRNDAQSLKIAKYVRETVNTKGIFDKQFLCDLGGNALPMWNPSEEKTLPEEWAQEFQSSDGFVIVSPEWHGMVPPGLKNLLLQCGTDEVAHKPALIVTVSSSQGGSYPNDELRITAYKNNRLLYIPDHVIVRNAKEMMNDFQEAASGDDTKIRDRIEHSLQLLRVYSEAMQHVRQSDVPDFKTYKYGM